jgi:dTDP-4-amino-4,6-dideoxygalactose transaminase
MAAHDRAAVSTEPVPFVDLGRRWAELRDDVLDAVDRVAAAGEFSLGAELALFESEFATYCGASHCVGVANGTVALELVLRALGAGPGREVVTVAHTFVATVEAIHATGATPVLVDIDPATRCMDPRALDPVLRDRTVAVVPVHLYGHPAPLTEIRRACAARDIPVVEDAAQAHGATLDGQRAGTIGAAGCFSFYPTKNLGAMGDGGAVVTDGDDVAATVRSLRHHGAAVGQSNRHLLRGRTERLDNLQAAILRLRLRRLDNDNNARRRIAARYREQLANLPVVLPAEDAADVTSVYHLFAIEVDGRDDVREALRVRGIATGVHYPTPVHLQPAWRSLGYDRGALPATENVAERILSLPIFPGLREAEVDRVCEELAGALVKAA